MATVVDIAVLRRVFLTVTANHWDRNYDLVKFGTTL